MVILFDWISLFFMCLVTYISWLVINYSFSYIEGAKNFFMFSILVMLFVFSIILIIISPNIIRILLGWDGLGLVSYLLVIYYQNIKSYNAGILTVLSNRIGDVIILIVIGLIISLNRWNYYFYIDFLVEHFYFIGWLIIIAGITKRAQIPFSSWLPAAMAAPTPVSALVHSSTLVTAGVYLLIRFSSLFIESKFSIFLLIISGITIFIAGLGANFEYDLKKIIALSTLRQLGLIISRLSLGLTNLCFFHLLRHALFKALLFLCAGFMIHRLGDCQDIRYIGGIRNQFPVVILFFNTANLSLCGFPFLAGFYSKDLILEVVSIRNLNCIRYLLFFVSTGLTITYSFRLFSFLMVGRFNISCINNIADKDAVIWSSILGLYLGALMGGSAIIWLVFPFSNLIILPSVIKLLVVLLILLISYLSTELFKRFTFNIYFFKNKRLNLFLGSMWIIPLLSTQGLIYLFIYISKWYVKLIDLGWMEKLGGQGIKGLLITVRKTNFYYQGFIYKSYLFIFIYIYIVVIYIWLFF